MDQFNQLIKENIGDPAIDLETDNRLMVTFFQQFGHRKPVVIFIIFKFVLIQAEITVPRYTDQTGFNCFIRTKQRIYPVQNDILHS